MSTFKTLAAPYQILSRALEKVSDKISITLLPEQCPSSINGGKQLLSKPQYLNYFKDSSKDCAEDYMAFLRNVLRTCTGTKSQGRQTAGIFIRQRKVNSWDMYKRI